MRKIFTLFLTFVFAVPLWAVQVSYVDADGTTKTLTNGEFTLLQLEEESDISLDINGFYVVGADYNDDGVINAADAVYGVEHGQTTDFTVEYIEVDSGDGMVNLILADGFTLTTDDVELYYSNFSIYGQEEGTGTFSFHGLPIELRSYIKQYGGKFNFNIPVGDIVMEFDSHIELYGGEFNITDGNLIMESGSTLEVHGGEFNFTPDIFAAGISMDYDSQLLVDGGEFNLINGSFSIDENSTISVAENMQIYRGTANPPTELIASHENLATTLTGYKYVTIKDDAANVVKAINAIGTVEYTTECKTKIDAARAAYDALSEELKEYVSNYTTLTTAEATYKQLKPLVVSYVDADGTTKTIDKKVDAITLVESANASQTWSTGYYVVGADYNDDGEINEADATYASENNLTTNFTINGTITFEYEVKLILADGFTLTVSNDFAVNYGDLTIYGQEEGTGLLETNIFYVNSGSLLTVNGGEVNVAEIRNNQYSPLTVNGGEVNVTRFVALDNGSSLTVNGGEVNVIGGVGLYYSSWLTVNGGEVNVTGDVALGYESSLTVNGGEVNVINETFYIIHSTISVAENMQIFGGDANPPTELIANDADLTTALVGYKYFTIKVGAGNVVKTINAIGTVTYTDECKTKIDAARSAYDALNEEFKAYVTNYAILTTAETTYEQLKPVVEAINAIGTVTYIDECKTKILAARTSYDALSEELKANVSNYATLTAAEATYEQLKPLVVSYVDADGTTKKLTKGEFTLLQLEEESDISLYVDGFYVVGADYNDDGEINAADAAYGVEHGQTTDFTVEHFEVTFHDGMANLILADGFTLTTDDVELLYGSNFTIYGQEEGTGLLETNNFNYSSSLTVNGGEVNVTKGVTLYESLLTVDGGEFNVTGGIALYSFSSLTVNGGEVNVTYIEIESNSTLAVNGGEVNVTKGVTLYESLLTVDGGEFNVTDIYIAYRGSLTVNGGEFNVINGTFDKDGTETISVAENMQIYGGAANPPTELIANDADLATSLTGYKYLTIKDEAVNVVKAINAIGTVAYTDECKAKIDAARTAYDALSEELQPNVTNYATLTAAETTYNQLKIDALAAEAVEAKIESIGTVEYTAESKAKIDAAREAYDELTEAQQALVDNVSTLTAAETTYNQLKTDALAAEAVEAKIESIGTVEYTAESKAKIDEVREAYNQLTDDQKTLVDNYATLTEAETTYEQSKTDVLAAESVESKIESIGTVEYTTESKAKIDAARKAYDELTEAQQALVDNVATLTEAAATYDQLKADALAAESVETKIESIGTVEYTAESKAKIDAAREAYDELTDDQKALVDNYATLTAAEATYNQLRTDVLVAEAVETKIESIGTVEYTAESKAKIDAAREAYDELTEAQQALVDIVSTLTVAETTYDQLKADALAAEAVETKIESIGTVEYTAESKAKIDAAREAYDELTDDQKALVDNYATLTAAEATYNQLRTDVLVAEAVETKIESIGTVEYTAESKAKIDAAREAYEELTDDQQALVDNVAILTAAEAAYNQLKADALAVDDVEAKIESIGTVEYTAESKAKIDEAREAYEDLTDDQQALVDNVATLTAAEATYNQLKTDALAAEAVEAKIESIGTVEYTAESKAKIDTARTAYDALTTTQQALVSNYATLTTAEKTYSDLTIASVVAKINEIGTVEYTAESKAKIDAAREAYEDLTDDQQALVDNVATLTAAEATYNQLKTDALAAEAVEAKIESIGTVEYTAESKAKIDEARTAYDALTTAQQALVSNYSTLTDAEATYNDLTIASVVAKINEIGTVTYTDESKAKIDAAREAYNQLTETQKALVDNVETLTEAEETYEQLKTDVVAAEAVEAKIESIGTVEYTDESKAKVDEARDAYNQLTDDQKALVDNYGTLTEAEATYNQLKADALAAETVEAKIESIGTVEYTDESKAKIDEAREAYDELTEAQQALIGNVATLTAAETTYNQLESETTLVEEVISNPTNSAYKIIKEGRVLIIKDGAMYTLNGQKVE